MSRTRRRTAWAFDPDAPPDYVTCRCGKVGWLTRAAARRSRATLRAGSVDRGKGRKTLHVYRCPRAEGLWHVGHRPPENRCVILDLEGRQCLLDRARGQHRGRACLFDP